MFTIAEITTAHSKVKSGADFPKYIQDLVRLGVQKYESHVSDGHVTYFGNANFSVTSPAMYEEITVSDKSDDEKLRHALKIHQQGETDYHTFCLQVAEAGVEKWQVDMQLLTCTYFDKSGGQMVVEKIPNI